jgi:hypothetical protein
LPGSRIRTWFEWCLIINLPNKTRLVMICKSIISIKIDDDAKAVVVVESLNS